MSHMLKVGSRGRLTIPREIRKDLHLFPGTFLAVVARKDVIVLKPLKRLSEFGGILRGTPLGGRFVGDVRKEWDR